MAEDVRVHLPTVHGAQTQSFTVVDEGRVLVWDSLQGPQIHFSDSMPLVLAEETSARLVKECRQDPAFCFLASGLSKHIITALLYTKADERKGTKDKRNTLPRVQHLGLSEGA